MIFLFLNLACTDPQGTIIGNPGDGKGKLAGTSDERVLIHNAIVLFPEMRMKKGDETEHIDLHEEWDEEWDEEFIILYDSEWEEEHHSFEVPGGEWDELKFDGYLYIEGELQTEDEEDEFRYFELEFEVDLDLDGQQNFMIDGEHLILEFGTPDWLTMENLMPIAEAQEEEEWDDEQELFTDFADITAKKSGFYNDADGDGILTTEERTIPVAYTQDVAEEVAEAEAELAAEEAAADTASEDTGSTDSEGTNEKKRFSAGCSDNSVQISLIPLLMFLILGRRRED